MTKLLKLFSGLLESLTGENIKIVETPASNRNYYSSRSEPHTLTCCVVIVYIC